MDAFEQVVSELLWMEWLLGSHVRQGRSHQRGNSQYRRPSSPRWELDIVGYSGRDNVLRVVECKSYLDSRGVALRAFDGSDSKFAERFKLFSDYNLRHVVFGRLRRQLAECGACFPDATVKLCLGLRPDCDHDGSRRPA